jgi:Tol biopolymer transport system component
MNEHDDLVRTVRERVDRLPIQTPSPGPAMACGRRRRRISRAATAAAALVVALGVALPLRALSRLGEDAPPPVGPTPSAVEVPGPTGTIAFIDGNQAFGPIALLDVASGSTERLTRQSFNSISLAWSPDGSLIAVTDAVLEGNGEIVLVSTETGEVVRTMPIETGLDPQDVAWSPDGRSLAFTATFQRLYTIDVDGSNLRSIPTDDRRALGIEFSPSGDEIAFIGDKGDLSVVSLVSGETRVLVSDRGIGYAPAWSPDGTRIAFSSDGPDGVSIDVVRADGSDRTTLVDDSVYAVNPSWSPDGNWISFERVGDDGGDLYAVAVKDGSLRQLTDTPSDEFGSGWGRLPDGSTVEQPRPSPFVPPIRTVGEITTMPLTFPDGTNVTVRYPSSLALAERGIIPSITVCGRTLSAAHGDATALFSSESQPIAEFEGVDGDQVGLWKGRPNLADRYLIFRFDDWTVAIPDQSAYAMSDEEASICAANLTGEADRDGFLLLRADGPLEPPPSAGPHGPQLIVGEDDRSLVLYLQGCTSQMDEHRAIEEFAEVCFPEASVMMQVYGPPTFIDAVVEGLTLTRSG